MRKVVWRALIGGLIAGSSSHQTQNQSDKEAKITMESEGFVVPRYFGTGGTPIHRRLWKINDRAYGNWEGFLRIAGDKMGVDALGIWECSSSFATTADYSIATTEEVRKREREREEEKKMKKKERAENCLQVLHTLRCLLGPVVESMILLDRLVWVQEELRRGGCGMVAELVNLFDQDTGSGRNVAIVVKPSSNSVDSPVQGPQKYNGVW